MPGSAIDHVVRAVSGDAVSLRSRPARELIDRVAKRVFETIAPMTVSEWAAKYRYLPPKVSAAPGLIDLDKTPYLRGFMDAFGRRDVFEIIWQKCVQVGGTTGMDTMPLWAVCYAPGPGLWLAPNATLSGEAAKDRIEPAARMSPATRDRIGEGATETKEDVTSKKIDFDVMRITFAGSGTKNSMIARAIKYGFIDDFDRCEEYTHGQMLDRVSSFNEHKVVSVGNPTYAGRGIASHYERSNKQYFAVRCPHPDCGHEHELVWKNLRWKGGLKADPDEVRRTAWMQCPACKGRIENHHKPAMLRAGRWIAERPDVTTRQGFRLSALYSPFQNFGWCAKGFLDAGGKPDPSWVNNVLGLPWREKGKSIDIRALKALAAASKGGRNEEGKEIAPVGGAGWCATRVPDDCCVLCAAIDVQEDYTYVLVMGFSPYGLRAYYIDRFTLPASEHVSLLTTWQTVRQRRYQRMDGRWMRVLMQVWDTGHRAVEVYAVARAAQGVNTQRFVPVKGQGSLTLTKAWWRSSPEAVGTQAAEAGVEILNINTRLWKDKVADAVRAAGHELGVGSAKEDREKDILHNESSLADLEAEDGGRADVAPGAMSGVMVVGAGGAGGVGGAAIVLTTMYFPFDVPGDVLQHFAAEHIVEGRWVKIGEGVRNEAWDLAYYLAAGCDAGGIRQMTMEQLAISLMPRPSDDQIQAWGVRWEERSAVSGQSSAESKPAVRPPKSAMPATPRIGADRLAAVREAMKRRRGTRH